MPKSLLTSCILNTFSCLNKLDLLMRQYLRSRMHKGWRRGRERRGEKEGKEIEENMEGIDIQECWWLTIRGNRGMMMESMMGSMMGSSNLCNV